MNEGNIKHIAIYLRKSRAEDGEDVLWKHRDRLVSFAESNGWTYDIFEEIVSGASIKERPQIKKILELIEKNLYDGLLVIDYDRLSRGGTKDFGIIIEICQYSDTPIITPTKTYDVNNTSDLMMLGVQGVFSNAELRQITTRFIEGKKSSTKRGNWANGKPPYPYIYVKKVITDDNGYQKVIGTVEVDKDKAKVYEYIKEKYLSGDMGFEAIAFRLNELKIPSPNGVHWNSNTVQRILLHKFHMGIIEYGKNVWRKSKNGKKRMVKKRSENEIITGIGHHDFLKTDEEHQKILEIMNSNNKVPKRSRAGAFPTSGLLYCKKCGSRMGYAIGRQEAKTGKIYAYTRCTHKSPTGIKCEQRGVKMDENFYHAIFSSIIKSIDTKEISNTKNRSRYSHSINTAIIKEKKEELIEVSKKLLKIFDAYENNVYSLEQFFERKSKQENMKSNLEKEIALLEKAINSEKALTKIELEKRIVHFKKNWLVITSNQDKNKILRSIVNKIYYDREGDIITFEIEYL